VVTSLVLGVSLTPPLVSFKDIDVIVVVDGLGIPRE